MNYIEPPRGATPEELYAWARNVCELLNRCLLEQQAIIEQLRKGE